MAFREDLCPPSRLFDSVPIDFSSCHLPDLSASVEVLGGQSANLSTTPFVIDVLLYFFYIFLGGSDFLDLRIFHYMAVGRPGMCAKASFGVCEYFWI